MGSRITGGVLEHDDMTKNARGGTELLAERLVGIIDPDMMSQYQIHLSRTTSKDDTKKQILWAHDLATDPAVSHLKDGGWQEYDKIVFVSHWQQEMFNLYLGVPYSHGVVIENFIDPIDNHTKPNDKIRLVYFSTPHRGLAILYPVFDALSKLYPNELELRVFSSFDLYGWEDRDKPFKDLFEKLESHPDIVYSKSVPNEQIREELKECHVFAYPSMWQETSCLCLIEAMSAGLSCVHSSYGALPETSGGITSMYSYEEDHNIHANKLFNTLQRCIEHIKTHGVSNDGVKNIADYRFNTKKAKEKWEYILSSL